jgi:15-cis-phytoene synthase
MRDAVLTPDALAACHASIATHSKSFSLASRLFAAHIRDCASVVYAWCRRADDAIDAAGPEQQSDALVRLRAELSDVYDGPTPSRDPVLSAFRGVIQLCAIPRLYPEELLAGMEMDASGARYGSLEELHLYCYRVAGTVGLMMSHVMGVRDDEALRNAAHLGIAMQLTNICRDVLEDWEMGRLYLPRELLEEYGAGELESKLGGPFPSWATASTAMVVRCLLEEAELFYASGDRGLPALPWRCALAVRTARLVYAAIGSEIRRAACDVRAGRAVVPDADKLRLVARAAASALIELPARGLGVLFGRARPHVPHTRVAFPEGVLPV